MSLFLDDGDVRLYQGDALEQLRGLPDGCVNMIATSPPFYGLRDYGTGTWEGGDPECDHMDTAFNAIPQNREGRETPGGRGGSFPTTERQFGKVCGKCGARRVDRQIGLEETPDQWVTSLVAVFRECRRVLADHGTLWVEIGDSYMATPTGNRGTKSALHGAQTSDKYKETLDRYTDAKLNRQPVPEGLKQKDLLGQPWMLAFALRADGWYLRSEIIWARPNPMPESVTDRPTKSHSTIFLLSKGPRYFFDQDAIREPYKYDGRKVLEINGTSDAAHENYANREGKTRWPGGVDGGANARSVWTIPTEPTPFAHFATWPRKLVARMIQAGTSECGCCPECGAPWVRKTERAIDTSRPLARQKNGQGTNARTSTTLGWSPSCAHQHQPVPCTVLDPFAGSGTTLLVARNHQRHAIGIELNADYCRIAANRLSQLSLLTEAQA